MAFTIVLAAYETEIHSQSSIVRVTGLTAYSATMTLFLHCNFSASSHRLHATLQLLIAHAAMTNDYSPIS